MIKKFKDYLLLFGVMITLPGLWLLFGYLRIGADFTQFYLLRSDHGVANIALSKFNTDYVRYAYYSLQRRFFWVLLLGIVFAISKINEPKYFLLVLYATVLVVELSFTQRSNNWYLIPAMPFWSILIAYGTYRFIKLFRSNPFVILAIILLAGYVSYKTFFGNIVPIFDTASTQKQVESALILKRLTKENDVIVRLDHLYPATVYYTERRILASPSETVDTKDYWIGRAELLEAIGNKKIKWLIGTPKDTSDFQNQASDIKFKVRSVNDSEAILEVL